MLQMALKELHWSEPRTSTHVSSKCCRRSPEISIGKSSLHLVAVQQTAIAGLGEQNARIIYGVWLLISG
jgi:hypothetical protein